MTYPSWKLVGTVLLLCSLSFVAGRVSVRKPLQANGQASTSFLEDMGEITKRYAQEDSQVHSLQVSDQEKGKRWEDIRRRRMAEIRSLYETHGKPFPK